MNWGQFLFSFRGRVNRAKYWLFILVSTVLAVLLAALLSVGALADAFLPVLSIVGVIYLIMVYSGLAVGAKRLHDRNKSGWWLVVFYIVPGVLSGFADASGDMAIKSVLLLGSLAFTVWAFVELGCLGGTFGPNDYGPDPIPEGAARTR